MVSFFEDKPMWTTGARSHCLQIHKKLSKKQRTIKQRDAKEVHIDVHIGVLQYPENFVEAWDAPLISDCHETLNSNIITLRVHDADLIGLLNKTFNKTGSQCGLPSS